MNPEHARLARAAKHANLVIACTIAAWFFFIPGFIVIRTLCDPALRSDAIPRAARRLFRVLTPRYERWANARTGSGAATGLSLNEIAGTEWPLFGSVFYLWAVEELQTDWDRTPGATGPSPRDVARGAIEAAAELVIDPEHASWVKQHWGEDYLHRENVFYRMLIISALTSHHNLTGDPRHLAMLRDQVESLADELDRSPLGILNDYPNECYPTDVMMAIASIRRADAALGTDHAAFAARAIRGFEGKLLDELGLPPYNADLFTGKALDGSRGCGISYACMSAPYVWPDVARNWYALYEKYFWQERYGLHGFREFPRNYASGEWYMDVDSGPVLGGIGVSASAFGLAASRIMGRFDRAWPLAAQTIVFSWPLPDGTLLTPRILSNAAHAPHLGEACILYNLTRRAAPGMDIRTGGALPPIVMAATAVYFALGLAFVGSEWISLRRWLRRADEKGVGAPRVQFALWVALLAGAVTVAIVWGATPGVASLLLALLVPVQTR